MARSMRSYRGAVEFGHDHKLFMLVSAGFYRVPRARRAYRHCSWTGTTHIWTGGTTINVYREWDTSPVDCYGKGEWDALPMGTLERREVVRAINARFEADRRHRNKYGMPQD